CSSCLLFYFLQYTDMNPIPNLGRQYYISKSKALSELSQLSFEPKRAEGFPDAPIATMSCPKPVKRFDFSTLSYKSWNEKVLLAATSPPLFQLVIHTPPTSMISSLARSSAYVLPRTLVSACPILPKATLPKEAVPPTPIKVCPIDQ